MTTLSLLFYKPPVRLSKILQYRKMSHRSFQRAGKKITIILFCASLFTFWSHLFSHKPSSQKPYPFLASSATSKSVPTYGINPVSSLRPINQFSFGNSFCRNGEHLSQPILTLLTVTKNPRHVITETASFIRSQSFCAIRWVIISDHTTDRNSYGFLENIASKDPRITLLNSSRSPGISYGRDFALEKLRQSPTPYFAFIDDDDMFELTAYEKLIWLLESNQHLHMAGSFVVGYGEKNYTWTHGLHDGLKVYTGGNPLVISSVMRTDVLFETPCRFDPSLISGTEDWDFYLCLAAHGKWGSTVSEYLFWYRQNPVTLRKQRWSSLFEDQKKTEAYIRTKYENLSSAFPEPYQKQMIPQHINMTIPFANKLRVEHGVMVILSSEDILDCNSNAILTIRSMSRNRQRVTVVNTAVDMKDPGGALHRCIVLSTHDIFNLPAMLHIADVPRFLSYLITSRSIDRLFMCQTCYARSLLPWLASLHRNVELYALTESMTEKANKQEQKSYRFLWSDSRCTLRLMESSEEALARYSNVRPWERAGALRPWFWSSHSCSAEIFRTTQRVLREMSESSNEDNIAYSHEQVHEFLTHSL